MRLVFILTVNLNATPANPGEMVVFSHVKCAWSSSWRYIYLPLPPTPEKSLCFSCKIRLTTLKLFRNDCSSGKICMAPRTRLFQIAWPGWTEMVRKVSGHFEKISFAFRLTGVVIRPPANGYNHPYKVPKMSGLMTPDFGERQTFSGVSPSFPECPYALCNHVVSAPPFPWRG